MLRANMKLIPPFSRPPPRPIIIHQTLLSVNLKLPMTPFCCKTTGRLCRRWALATIPITRGLLQLNPARPYSELTGLGPKKNLPASSAKVEEREEVAQESLVWEWTRPISAKYRTFCCLCFDLFLENQAASSNIFTSFRPQLTFTILCNTDYE